MADRIGRYCAFMIVMPSCSGRIRIGCDSEQHAVRAMLLYIYGPH